MMKKIISIFFLSLFFLFGVQCVAGKKREASFAKIEFKNCLNTQIFQQVSKHEKSPTFSSIEKLHKKKRFSRTHQNATASLSKCNGNSLSSSALFSTKYLFSEYLTTRKSSGWEFGNSICYRKLLSLFYSFQAFW